MALMARQILHEGGLKNEYDTRIEHVRSLNLVSEIIKKNLEVFGKREKSHQKIILNRLGWIDVVRRMPDRLERIENLVRQVKGAGLKHLFVLGMGGSSLCPEVFGKIFGRRSWLKSYNVVDTTAPGQIEAFLNKTDPKLSFYIVSSKSGSTIETISQFRFFFKKIKELRPLKAGSYFAAVTDEGSDLHRIARRNRFRETFLNAADIGGRYSALSFFGLVPGGFTKASLKDIVKSAGEFLEQLESSGNDNDALSLGVFMGVGALNGMDKVTFRASSTMKPFVAWVEQLVAESTGKEKKGIVPIEGEPAEGFLDCADDRIYVYYHLKGDPYPADFVKPKGNSKYPTVTIELDNPHALGAEILKWEMATTIASVVIGVNPGNQ